MKGIPNPLQHTKEWWLARRGKLTASRIDRVVHGTMKGWSSFMDELEVELLLDDMPDRFPNGTPRAIQHGWDHEAIACAVYEVETGHNVTRAGFAQHPDIPQVGASSDFLVLDELRNGEVKCPLNLAHHTRVVMNRQVPQEYFGQIQCQMWCHGFPVTDFVSYHPDHPDWRCRLAVVTVNIDGSYIERMGNRVTDFLHIFNAGRRPRDVDPKSVFIKRKFF